MTNTTYSQFSKSQDEHGVSASFCGKSFDIPNYTVFCFCFFLTEVIHKEVHTS